MCVPLVFAALLLALRPWDVLGMQIPQKPLLERDAEGYAQLVRALFSGCRCLHVASDGSPAVLQVVTAVSQDPPCPVDAGQTSNCSDHAFFTLSGSRNLASRHPSALERILLVALDSLNNILEATKVFGDAEAIVVTKGSLAYRLTPAVLSQRRFEFLKNSEIVFLGVSRSRYADLQNRTLIVNTFTLLPFSYVTNDTLDGIEMQMFCEISRRLNFSWRLMQPPENNRYGEWLENKTWRGGIAGLLVEGKSDVGFCTLYVVRNKIMHLDMSRPWTRVCITFLVPVPQIAEDSWRAPLSPFHASLWLALVAALLLEACTLWFTTWVQRAVGRLGGASLTPGQSVLQVLGGLLATSFPDVDPRRPAVRHVLLSWSFFGLLIITAYCSNLVTHLTVQRYEDPVNTAKDFVRAGLYWGMNYEVPREDIFNYNNRWSRAIMSHFQWEQEVEDRAQRLKGRNYAILSTRVNGRVFYEGEAIDQKALNRLRGMESCLSHFFIAYAFRKRSPLTTPFNVVMGRIVESGLAHHWQENVILFRKSTVSTAEDFSSYIGEPQKLTVHNLMGAYLILFVGLGVATIAFFIELYNRPTPQDRHKI